MCMDLELASLLENLKEDYKNLDSYKEFLVAEKKLEESDEIKVLSYKKDIAIMEYGDTLRHFDKNSKEVLEASKKMAKAIYDLNNHEISKKYNEKLAKLNEDLSEIQKSIFEGIND